VISSDREGISSHFLFACPLEKAKLNDLNTTSKNPEWIV
jgi:hypothetical protein